MLSADQSYEDNRREFIERLIAAGWRPEEAEAEWESIQGATEGEP